jgi:hypothetical protein
MNLRHAAALSMLGWYLMVPPFAGKTKPEDSLGLKAPVDQWMIIQSFDSEKSCNGETVKMKDGAEKMLKQSDAAVLKNVAEFKTAAEAREWLKGRAHATCIARDDPRLKDK